MPLFKKNTERKIGFVMIDSTDHVTPKTGLTVTAQVSKDGGAFANATNTVSEVSNGYYTLILTATEMNADLVMVKLTATGADQQNLVFYTESDYTAARAANLDNLDSAISSRATPADILIDPPTDKIDGSNLDAKVSERAKPSDILLDPAEDKIKGSWIDKPISGASALHSYSTDAYISAPSSYNAVSVVAEFRLVDLDNSCFELGILCQYPEQDSQNRYYLLVYCTGGSNGLLELKKNIGGVITTIRTATITIDSKWHIVILKREANGHFEVYWDGTKKIDETDTSLTSGNYIAIGSWDRIEVKTYDVNDLVGGVWVSVSAFEWSVILGDIVGSLSWFYKRLKNIKTQTDSIPRALGLALENFVEDDIVRDANKNKTSSVLYLYDTAAHAQTHDKVTGLVAKYNVTISYDANGMSLMKAVKV